MSSFKTFNGYEVEDAYARKSVGELSKVVPAIGEARGTDITITDSSLGEAIGFDGYGRSTQKQYSGKNKFNVANIPNLTGLTNNNGVLTITNNYTILVTIALSELADLVVGETYTLSFKTTSTNNFIYVRGAQYQWTSGTPLTITQAMLDGGINLYGDESGTVTISDIQIEKGSTSTNYEPYVGGTPSPNPSYPQAIKSVGDMGYFDGELLQGYYDTSGTFVSDSNYICSKNPIPCNSADITKLIYDGLMSSVCLVFYDKDMNLLSRPISSVSTTEYETNAPTNAKYMHFLFRDSNGNVTPQTAKHICVTINGKYALIVDSVGKNELENTATSQMINGVVFTVNEDKSVTINTNGATTANSYILLGTYTFKANERYILSGQKPNTLLSFGTNSDGTSLVVFDNTPYTPTKDITLYARIWINKGVTVNDTIYPMLRLASVTDATYEPYIHSRKYIPISSPLRGIGEVTDVARLTEGKVERKFAEVVFDGSDDEGWLLNLNVGFTSVFYSELLNFRDNNLDRNKVICDHYIVEVMSNPTDYDYIISIGTYINVKDIRFTTLAEFKAWLSANPITVIYELAEPTTESIEPVEIDTFEGVTHISASDNADCKVSYYRNNEDGKKMQELDNRMVTAEDTINNLESNAVAVAGDIEDIKTSMRENPLLVTLAPSDELPTIVAGSNVGTFKDTWLNRVINDYEYLIIVVRHRNGSKQIVQIPSMLIEIGGTYTFPFNDVQNNINGAYITINSATRYGIGIFGTLPNDISFELYKYGKPISVG